jgi:hypothetical protein
MGLSIPAAQAMANKHGVRLESVGEHFEMFDEGTGDLLGLGEGDLWSLDDVKQFCETMEEGDRTGTYII